MTAPRRLLILLLVCVALIAVVADDKVKESVPARIDALHDAWRSALERGDLEAVFDLLAPDYTLCTPGTTPLTREALRPVLSAAVQRYHVTSTFERDELLVSGDLAFERG